MSQQDPQSLTSLCELFQAICPDFYSRIHVTHVHKKSTLEITNTFPNSCNQIILVSYDPVKHADVRVRRSTIQVLTSC